MAFIISAGTAVAIASTYGAVKAMSAITNASEAVATLEASHGVVVGDILEVTSGWPKLDGRLVRVKTVVTNSVTFEAIDTSSTTLFPAGSGTGSVRVISAWTSISQIAADITASGGEQQFSTIRLLGQEDEVNLPTTRTAVNQTLPVYFDPALGWFAVVRSARDSKTPKGVRFSYPGGAKTYGNAYWGIGDLGVPRDGVLATDITLSYSSQPQTYAT
jgi:hypothetical protein